MKAQYLDSMDLERERGITIKAQNVRVDWNGYVYHLIDTPGHVDFGYEVSRSLAACEGVVLVVDAAQGIEAQTLANCYLALEHDLEIVACLNKIDLPAADPDRYAMEIETVLGIAAEDILKISAKTGEGVPELLRRDRRADPAADRRCRCRAAGADLRLAVRPVPRRRVVGAGDERPADIRLAAVLHADRRHPRCARDRRPPPAHDAAGGARARRGRLPDRGHQGRRRRPLGRDDHDRIQGVDAGRCPGYQDPKPMVFSGLFPIDGDDFENLRESLAKLKLNDSSISYTPESSGALGFGFRCGFLGLLHMEIVKERLEREFDLALIATAPSVEYRVTQTDGTTTVVSNPSELPLVQKIDYIEEPVFRVSIITPKEYTGSLMELCQNRRGDMKKMEYLSPERVELHYEIPLAEVVVDFFDQLKSRSQGYASLDYELAGYQRANLVRVDILLNGLPADAFSTIVHRDHAEAYGRRMCEKLKELIPRQMFDVPIQAAIGGKVISRETVKARRKDVLAKCYGGDITRKRKLLEKQKEGKKKMKSIGRVEVPGDVFISALKLDD